MLMTVIILGYIGWMTYIVLHVLQSYTSLAGDILIKEQADHQTDNTRKVQLSGCLFLGLLCMILFIEQSPPLYHAYTTMTVFLWTQISSEYRFIKALWRQLSGRKINYFTKVLAACTVAVFILEYLVNSFTERKLYTWGFLTVGAIAFVYLFKSIPWRSGIPFFVCGACWFLSVFTLMPAEIPDNNNLVIWSGVMIIMVGAAGRFLDQHTEGNKFWLSICNSDAKKPKFPMLFQLQALLVGLSSVMVSISTSHRTQNQELHVWHQFINWSIAGPSMVLPLFSAKMVSCPGLRPYFLALHPHSFYYLSDMKLSSIVLLLSYLQLSDVRIPLTFLVLFNVAFFGTGNFAKYLQSFATLLMLLSLILLPFLMEALLIFKLFIPFLLVICVFSAITKLNRLPRLGCYFLVILFSDVMTMHFFFLVQNTGSWMEIGNSISHFGIVSAQVVFVLLLFALTNVYTKDIHIGSVEGSSRKAIPATADTYNSSFLFLLIFGDCFANCEIIARGFSKCSPELVENSKSKTPPLIIITGQYVGGVVATLFTLWLLEGFNVLKTKRPLCVTFGSPFVGDEHLRKCVLEFSTWKSCFLHVVSDQDHTPKLFMSRNTFGAYKPFGTFLLCSTSGSASSEDPDFISEQFVTASSPSAQTQDPNLGFPYGHILEDLKRKALCNVYKSIGGERDALEASLITQLLAVGVVSQQQSPDTDNLVGKMKKHETKLLIQKMKNSDNDKRLNDMKFCMANLEWYKKDSKRQNIGYYDRYREKGNESDINVNGYKKKLMNYWEDSVTEVENKPQMEGAHFRVRWLWGGTNYRRMVEPLHIADYYKDGGKNYISDGKRPKHFILLEEWLKKKDKPQEFLCNKTNPTFSLNQAAIQLFKSQYDELLQLKEKLVENSKSKTPSLVIITGQSVGGSVATLFTLWLLQGLNLSKVKRPFCVTFGSPLVGDEQLRQCVLKFSTWKSCFLHIVSNQDPTPQLFISRDPGAYKPFGTFLLCSALGCACLEDPDIILEQLVKTHAQNQECHYGNILSDLKCKALCNFSKSIEAKLDSSLQACLITQLQAIGILSQQQPSKEIDSLIVRMKKHETKLLIQKKKNSDSDKKLNEMKVHMAFLEWYKKESRQPKVGGYYDKYRNQGHISDVNVNEFKKKLMNYWEDSVTEVENKPQLEGAHFRVRWLWAGTNYRRMVEPLHIADYYKDGGKSYKTDGKRPKHFILLEEWLKKVDKPQEVPSKSKRQSVGSSLNEDSCFWAHVEEARMLCNLVKNESIEEKECALQELKKFEAYVYGSLKNYALSPEIFLEKSSFMQWLKEYKGVVEQPYSSLLLDFMKERNDQAYKEGTFIFP
ncbi:hypothetical protein ACLB2K_054033 [Fragaria x ananassa]